MSGTFKRFFSGKPYDGKYANPELVRYNGAFKFFAICMPIFVSFGLYVVVILLYQLFLGLEISLENHENFLLFQEHIAVLGKNLFNLFFIDNFYQGFRQLLDKDSFLLMILFCGYCFFVALFMWFSPFSQLYDASLSRGSGKIVSTLPYVKNYMPDLIGYGGVILGYLQGKPLTIKSSLSVLVMAPPGTGKSLEIFTPAILNDPNSMVIFDVKGEFFEKTAHYRSSLGPVGVIDFVNTKTSLRWNPLSYRTLPFIQDGIGKVRRPSLYREDGSFDIDSFAIISKTVRYVGGFFFPVEGQDPFWSSMAKEMFITIALYLYLVQGDVNFVDIVQATHAKKDDTYEDENGTVMRKSRHQMFETMGDHLLSFMEQLGLSDIPDKDEARKDIKKFENPDHQPDAADAAYISKNVEASFSVREDNLVSVFHSIYNHLSSFANLPEQTCSSILGNFDGKLIVLIDENVKNISSDSDFAFGNIRGVKGKPVTLYLNMKESDISSFGPYIKAFFEMLLGYVLDFDWKVKEGEKIITFCIDEFSSLGKMEKLIDAPKLLRSKGGRLVIAGQDRNQITNAYGEHHSKSINSVCSYHIYFPQNSPDIQEEVSKALGMTTVVEVKNQRSQSKKLEFDNHETQQERRLVTPEDVGSIPRGHVYCRVQGFGNRPLYLETAFDYKKGRYKDSMLRNRVSNKKNFAEVYNEVSQNNNFINSHPEIISFADYPNSIVNLLPVLKNRLIEVRNKDKKSDVAEKIKESISRIEKFLSSRYVSNTKNKKEKELKVDDEKNKKFEKTDKQDNKEQEVRQSSTNKPEESIEESNQSDEQKAQNAVNRNKIEIDVDNGKVNEEEDEDEDENSDFAQIHRSVPSSISKSVPNFTKLKDEGRSRSNDLFNSVKDSKNSKEIKEVKLSVEDLQKIEEMQEKMLEEQSRVIPEQEIPSLVEREKKSFASITAEDLKLETVNSSRQGSVERTGEIETVEEMINAFVDGIKFLQEKDNELKDTFSYKEDNEDNDADSVWTKI